MGEKFELYIVARSTEILKALDQTIKNINKLEAKKKKVTGRSIFLVLGEEVSEIDFYVKQLNNIINLYRKIFLVRKTAKYDTEFHGLEQRLLEIIADLEAFKIILKHQINIQERDENREEQAMQRLEDALNTESVQALEFERVLERALSKEEKKVWSSAKKALEKYKGSFLFRARLKLQPQLRLCLVGALFGLIACGDATVPDTQTIPVTREYVASQPIEIKRVSEFNNFKNIYNVLIYCADEGERAGVIQTLKSRNSRRSARAKFSVTRNSSIYEVNNYKVRGTGSTARREAVKIKIVVRGQTIPQVDGGYQLITLRGHVDDMPILYNQTESYQSPNAIYLLGGCTSAKFAASIADSNKAIIADKQTGESANNTYLLIQLLDLSLKYDTWDALKGELSRRSSRFVSQTYFVNEELDGYVIR
ncbi:hypothetical protein HN681_02395 [archaeon]|jgi:hypothetical protein|nr:hypothetical protein [archaeon]MBT4669948.1 hypothetical protein [archaeon]MBT7052643.1 hypothetical protein [archaeon]MBT7280887.1 hypothetical protein [archaeon]MBT8010269.1 hypothetical protein [archaeon]